VTTERTTKHLENLRHQLRLSSEQQAAWDRFVSIIQETIASVRPPPEGTASEQEITAYDTALDAHLEAVRTIRDALFDLRGSLDDAQRRKLATETAALLGGATAAEGGE
jgi:hypothetical protein